MSKRFTDSGKWDDPWFNDMSLSHKLIYLYILDKCDSVGVWKINLRLLEFHLNDKIDWPLFVSYMGERLHIIDDEKCWLTKFCDFQYGTLKEESSSKPIISCINLLKKHTLWKGYTKGIDTLKDKDKDKDKEKDKEKDKDILVNKSEIFIKVFKAFEEMRKKIKKPLTDHARDLIIQKLEKLNTDENIQIKILEQSIISSWQDVFPLKENFQNKKQERQNFGAREVDFVNGEIVFKDQNST